MKFRMAGLTFILLALNQGAAAVENLRSGYFINPDLGLKTLESRPTGEGKSGFIYRGEAGGVEVAVKGTALSSVAATRELAKVEYLNVLHLYDERGNPYQGQISQLVVCDKRFKPKETELKIDGKPVQALLAGATQRKGFGACNEDQISNFAEYFNFYDEKEMMVFAVRLFTPVQANSAVDVEAAKKRLQVLAGRLLRRESAR